MVRWHLGSLSNPPVQSVVLKGKNSQAQKRKEEKKTSEDKKTDEKAELTGLDGSRGGGHVIVFSAR